MSDLFEQATRQHYRYSSTLGILSVEDLWELPLQRSQGVSLDTVARSVNRELKSQEEENFVAPKLDGEAALLRSKLDVVKRIITVKLEEKVAKANSEARKSERQRLVAILDKKGDEELEAMSKEEILAKLNSL